MVKLINNIIMASNTHRGATLQVISSADNCECGVSFTMFACICNHVKSFSVVNLKRRQNCPQPYFYCLYDCILYNLNTVIVVVNQKIAEIDSCKINDQLKSLTQIGGGHWKCQMDTERDYQHSRAEINVWLRLYRSILSKCRYTSLESAVRSAALKAYSIANFRTANPVRVGSNENNKEQCHNLWQCQTIVDS
jgi:hypothetical protein